MAGSIATLPGDWLGNPAPGTRAEIRARCSEIDGEYEDAWRCDMRKPVAADDMRHLEIDERDALTCADCAPATDPAGVNCEASRNDGWL